MTTVQKMDIFKKAEKKNKQFENNTARRIESALVYPEISEGRSGIKVLDTYVNLKFLLDTFSARIRHNLMTRRREVFIPGKSFFEDDKENHALNHIEYLATLNMMPAHQIEKHLETISMEDPYHPVVECIKSNPWDGVPRLDNFIRETIKSSNPALDFLIIKTWMIGAIAAAHATSVGFGSHGVLVLQGAQGIGKTEWVKKLDLTNNGAVKTSSFLEPKNKDSVIGISRFWIAELGELDGTFNRSDIAHLKSFITAESDFVRVPWGRREINFVRRTAYIATVNSANFLVDDTGNRRWWTICAEKIDYQHTFDMKQVWAEAKVCLDQGALTHLPAVVQSQVDKKNQSHETIDPIQELIATRYDWESPIRRNLTSTSILIEIGILKPSRSECTRAGSILCKMNEKSGRRANGVTLHEIPYLIPLGFERSI